MKPVWIVIDTSGSYGCEHFETPVAVFPDEVEAHIYVALNNAGRGGNYKVEKSTYFETAAEARR